MAVDIPNLAVVTKAALVDNSGNVIGVPAAPVRVDPTGTTAQPVSGTITANQGTAAVLSGKWPVQVTDGTNTMPTGDAVSRAVFNQTIGVRNPSTISGTWNSSTPNNTISVGLATTGYSTVTIELIVTGTITAGQISFFGFEANGGDAAVLAELGSNVSVTQGPANPATFATLSSLTPGSYYVATINVAGFDTFKFYLNPAIVGTGSVAWYAQVSSAVALRGYNKLWDGTSVATVKAASTAAGASDTSLVVGLSPNSPLPTGSNSIGTVTANQGTASGQSAAGWPVQPWGMADTLFASGLVTNPAAGAAIATLTTPPAGTYRVDIYSEAATGADMELRKGASVLVSFLGSSGPFQPLKDARITADGATNISVNATVGGAASGAYIAQIIATRIF